MFFSIILPSTVHTFKAMWAMFYYGCMCLVFMTETIQTLFMYHSVCLCQQLSQNHQMK